jgi:hypothetical protein
VILAVMGLGLFVSACGVVTAQTSSIPQTAVSFSCRLPIGSEGGDFGGFVSFPQATFERGSDSSLTYDAAHQRWLPVGRQMLSPDGTSYVYAQDTKVPAGAAIHVVDTANGQDRLVWTEQSAAFVLGWTERGIAILRATARPNEPSFVGPQLWVLSPSGQTMRLVAGQPTAKSGFPLFKAWTELSAGGVWSKSITTSSTDILLRIDPQDGHVTPWYGAREPVYLTVLGMDSTGHPLLEVTTPQSSKPRVVLVPAPNTALAVNGAGPVPSQPTFGSSVSDEHGTWLAAADGGIWLYDPKAGIRRVAQLPLPPKPSPVSDMGMPSITPVVAGPCLS